MYGQRLEALRNDKGLTKKDVAKVLGIHESTYGKYELEKREPDVDMFNKLAQYYDVSIDFLHGRTDEQKPVQVKIKSVFPSDFSYSFYNGYKELNDDNRALLHDLMEKMRLSQQVKDTAQD